MFDWPYYDGKQINEKLEEEMGTISTVIQSILSLREKIQLGVRWPLKEAVIVTKDKNIGKAIEKLSTIIKKQTNVKEVKVQEKLEGVKSRVEKMACSKRKNHKQTTCGRQRCRKRYCGR